MAVSYPFNADSSPTDATAEVRLGSEAEEAAPIAPPGVRNGSGLHPEPASNSSALTAIALFFRCSMS